MTKEQALGYALFTLKRILPNYPEKKDPQEMKLLEEFSAQMKYVLEEYTPEEAEEWGHK